MLSADGYNVPERAPKSWTFQGSDDKENWTTYRQFMDNQLIELFTGYGRIGAIWFDGVWDHDSDAQPFDWQLRSQYDLIHRLQPGCLVANNHHLVPFEGEDVQIFERDRLAAQGDAPVVRGHAEHIIAARVGELQQKRAVVIIEQTLRIGALGEAEADPVAEAHLHHGLGVAARAGGVAGRGFSAAEQFGHLVKHREQGGRHGQAVFVDLRSDAHHGVPGSLELGGDNTLRLLGGHGEGPYH